MFEQALKVSLASPLLLSCGAPGVNTSQFDAPACDGSALAVRGLMPQSPVDYTELRSIFMPGMQGSTESLVSSAGTKCGTASNAAACDAALTALKASSGFNQGCTQVCTASYLATTAGDTVSSLITLDALKAFLGTIDTPQEAVLLGYASGFAISCGDKQRGAVRKTDKGFEIIGTTGFACGAGTFVTQHVVTVNADGSLLETGSSVIEVGQNNCAVGRRPHGLQALHGVAARSALARHFVVCAHLEAASVPAFLRLHDELSLHGAPAALQLQAVLSAADEVRHTRAVAQLARRFGGAPVRPRVAAHPARPLFEVAKDNAVEGCVRETFGALVAHRQSLEAGDTHVAAAHRPIAADETRHAALSWDVHAWAMPKLSRDERAEIARAQREAVATLRAEVAVEVDGTLQSQAGLPCADEAVALVDGLDAELWSQA